MAQTHFICCCRGGGGGGGGDPCPCYRITINGTTYTVTRHSVPDPLNQYWYDGATPETSTVVMYRLSGIMYDYIDYNPSGTTSRFKATIDGNDCPWADLERWSRDWGYDTLDAIEACP